MNKKWCNKCSEELPICNFTKNAAQKDGLQRYCAECMKKVRRSHYAKNKDSHLERNKRKEAQLRQYVLDIKNTSSCIVCGVSYPNEPWLLEFDHLPEFEKLGTISQLLKFGSLEKLSKEIEKCELLCLICHRRRTAERGRWFDNRLGYLLG